MYLDKLRANLNEKKKYYKQSKSSSFQIPKIKISLSENILIGPVKRN